MLGDTVSVTINSVAKTLVKINQDSYGAEYFLKEATKSFRLKVRHSTDKLKTGQTVPNDRHNLSFVETVFATLTTPEVKRESYATIVAPQTDLTADVVFSWLGLQAFMASANATKIVNWES